MAVVTDETVSVVEVAPETLEYVVPPSVETCHCTVGAGEPEAAAVNVAVPPTVTVALAGCVVTTGAVSTVSVAAVVVAEPALFVNTARYCVPFCAAVVAAIVNVVEVAPEMFVNVELPEGADCHCTVGVGVPVAAAVNDAEAPATTVTFDGFVVTTGPVLVLTVSVAALDVAVPTLFVNTARYWLLFSVALVGDTVSVPVVLPASVVSFVNVVPPSVETCHCTVGVGLPEAAAVNVAAAGALTVTLAGLVVTVGAKSTVSVAAVVVAVPAVFVNTARYCVPFCAAVVAAIVNVVEVAPEMFVNVELPEGADCHCTVGDGEPEAAAENDAEAPALTVTLDGFVVTTGPVLTVSVAAVEVAVPAAFVNTARYSLPDSDTLVGDTVSVPVVLPASVVSLENDEPPLVDTCHCTVGVGEPEAAAVNVAAAGADTVALDGFVVTTGAVCTVSVAAVVVAVPPVFVNTARYCVPFCAAVVAAIVNVVEVAPEMFVNVELPEGADCHCTVGVGLPVAAAVNDAEAPATTVTFDGLVVMTGPDVTVSVAAVVVAVPTLFVNTASYSSPLIADVTEETVSVVEVAPVMAVNVVPPSVETFHCTVGVGLPEAAAVNVAFPPEPTDTLAGLVVTVGAKSTISVAAVVVAVPAVFVNTARYCVPFCAAVVAAIVNVVEVAPEMFVNVELPEGADCHCTVGDGEPEAAAENDAEAPALTVTLDGFVVTTGPVLTVSVAAVEVAVPAAFVNTARYSLPDSDTLVGDTVSVPVVLPASVVSLENDEPPLVDTCHCTVGVGEPEAAAVNVAAAGADTVALDGFVVTTGAVCTVSVAAVVVAVPPVFVNTARYCVPFCAAVVAAIVNVVEVAPEMFVNVELPEGADCHCTVGVGLPVAAAVNDAEAPATTVTFDGLVVMTGPDVTVSVAAVVVAVPTLFVNTASYSLLFIADVTEETVSVVEVAPVMAVNVVPPSVETFHCTVGVGLPEAAAVNVAFPPEPTDTLAGLVVTVGAKSTVSVAAVVVAVPAVFVNTARYCVPFCAAVVAAIVNVVEVAPEMFVNVELPEGADCHCTVGDGEPEAAAENDAEAPALTVTLDGFVVTAGTVLTVSVAAVEVAVPAAFVNTARYSLPDSDRLVGDTVSVPVVLPASVVSFENDEPPLVDTCHCTVGVGEPEAAAVNVAAAGAVTVALDGFVVTTGAVCTVSVAAVVVAEPAVFVNTARYCVPLSANEVGETVSVVEVAPEMFVNVELPEGADCHCTVGDGSPEAAAVNVAGFGAVTVWLVGLVVTVGTVLTVSVAAVEVAEPAVFVNTARYLFPFWAPLVGDTVSVPVVLPASVVSFVNVVPPSVETCHCTVGVGEPEAAAVNVAAFGAVTVAFDGLVVTVGAVGSEPLKVAPVELTVEIVYGPGGVAAGLVTALVNCARYSLPLLEAPNTTDSVSVVLPESVVSLAQVEPPFVETCHCTVGAGLPEAAAVNISVAPFVAFVMLVGLVVTAAFDVIGTEPSEFVGALQYTPSGPAMTSLPLFAPLGSLRSAVLST